MSSLSSYSIPISPLLLLFSYRSLLTVIQSFGFLFETVLLVLLLCVWHCLFFRTLFLSILSSLSTSFPFKTSLAIICVGLCRVLLIPVFFALPALLLYHSFFILTSHVWFALLRFKQTFEPFSASFPLSNSLCFFPSLLLLSWTTVAKQQPHLAISKVWSSRKSKQSEGRWLRMVTLNRNFAIVRQDNWTKIILWQQYRHIPYHQHFH